MPMDSGPGTLIGFLSALGAASDRPALGSVIVRQLAALAAAKTALLYVLDDEGRRYLPLAAEGPAPDAPPAIPVGVEWDRLGAAPPTEPILCASLGEAASRFPPETTSLLPLSARGRLLGFCLLSSPIPSDKQGSVQLERLALAGCCASLALDNHVLWNESRQTRRLMRRSDRMRSVETMAAGFAHEIRNPLTSIKTFITLAPDRRHDADFMARFSQVAAEDVERIERLIKEILDYARTSPPAFAPEDLNEVAAASVHFLELTAHDRAIEITKRFDGGLPPIPMDRHQIQQVLMNLFLNAIDAMRGRPGRLSLTTRRLRKHGTEDWVQLTVEDTGCGIPAEALEHIFDPFYTTKHESPEREGTGLGLAIAQHIVRDHRGYIEVVSEPGKGTTFTINLPVHPPAPLSAPVAERRREQRTTER